MPAPGNMRAVVAIEAGSPEVLRSVEIPLCEPGPGEVRLRVAYCGMNPFDTFVRAGLINLPNLSWPVVLGIEHTGLIDQLGEGVDPAWMGKRVISHSSLGGNAEYSTAPAASLIEVPEDMEWPLATAFRGCTSTAWHCLEHVARSAIGTAVIHSAAGPVGIMLTQIARERGFRVIGLAGGPVKIDFARPFGADELLDYRQPGWPDAVLELTDGRGADLVIDGNQGPEAEHNLAILAPLGQLIYIGINALAPAAPIPVGALIARSISVSGFTLANIECASDSDEARAQIEAVCSGRWQVPIGGIFDLEELPVVHERLARRELMGRTLIRVGGDL